MYYIYFNLQTSTVIYLNLKICIINASHYFIVLDFKTMMFTYQAIDTYLLKYI